GGASGDPGPGRHPPGRPRHRDRTGRPYRARGQPWPWLGRRRRPRHPPRPGTAAAARQARPAGQRVSGGAPVTQADVVPAVAAAGGRGGPLLRVLRLARPLRGRLLLSVLAGGAAPRGGAGPPGVGRVLLARAAAA